MFKKKFIYTNKQHTAKGIMSTILGVIELSSIAYSVYDTFDRGGTAPLRYASGCALSLFFSFIGIILALIGRKEPERFHIFAYIGLVLNIVAVAAISAILYAGAYSGV